MKATKVFGWGMLASLSTSLLVLAACGGVSDIGSGDEPGMGKAGSTGTSVGGQSMGANGSGATANGATSMGANGNVAGKDPGMGTGGATMDLCKTDADCPNPGSPCEPCADGSFACNRTYCDAGKCLTQRDQCTTKCATDKDCPVPKIACADCGDGSTSCPTSQCLMGQCQTSFPNCGTFDPCKGQACGTQCKVCGPDGTCDTMTASYCSAEGKCQPGLPQCAEPGMCKTPMDCGTAPPKCVPCGNDTCATFDCISGSCVFACPPNPEPQCKVTEDCPVIGDICKMCPNSGKCAVQACLQGSCELVCPL
jgi:hypothetical protein